MSSLLYTVYGLCTSMERNPLPKAPLALKFGIHQGQAVRKGVTGERKREGVWWVKSLSISPPSQNGQQSVVLML
jgi:hypothetical protein